MPTLVKNAHVYSRLLFNKKKNIRQKMGAGPLAPSGYAPADLWLTPPINNVLSLLLCFLRFRTLSFIQGNKMPHFGELHFQEDSNKLELRSKADEGDINEDKKTKKIIDLKGKYNNPMLH